MGGGGRVNTQREPLWRREPSLLGLLACSRRLDRGNGANRCEQTPGTGHVTARPWIIESLSIIFGTTRT